MNPTLLRRVLTYAAPFVIGYIVKKYEDRKTRKEEEKRMANSVNRTNKKIGKA
ncbi:MAG: hypothetical protein Q4G27_05245 [Flavobacteriaceae bacterium]|nr:hypothetical protein [Flavobacteriaceae bacterium]